MKFGFDFRVLIVWIVVLFGIGQWSVCPAGNVEVFDPNFSKIVFEVYRAGGERGLRDFLRQHRELLDKRNVVSFLQGPGVTLSEERLKIALVVAEENGYEALLGYVYLQMGDFYRGVDNTGKCIEYWEKAIPIMERSRYPKKEETVRSLRASIALLKSADLGEFKKAVDQIAADPQYTQDAVYQGIHYLLEGYFTGLLGDIKKAFANYKLARQCFEKNGDSVVLGYIEFSIGDIYKWLNVWPQALSLYDRALRHLDKDGSFDLRIEVYLRKADCYGRMGEFEDLDRLLAEAKRLAMDKGSDYWKARVFSVMGDWYCYRNQYEDARVLLDKAAFLFSSKGDLPELAHVLIAKASIVAHQKGIPAALTILENILLRLERERGDGEFGLKSTLCQFISHYSLQTGDHEHALEYLQRMESYEAHGRDLKYAGFYNLLQGDASAGSGKKKEALDRVRKAMTNIETYRMKLFLPSLQQGIGQDNFFVYAMAAAMMFENQEYELGFEMLERLRARVFLDRLAEGLVPLEKGVDQKLLEKRSRLLGELSRREKELHELAPESETRHSKRLKEDVQALESELEDLTADIRLKSPVYSSIQYPQPVSVKELQANILNDRETLVQFFCFNTTAMAIVISHGNFEIVPLEITEEKLSQLINSYRRSLKSEGGGQTIEGRRFAHLLYKKLFQPLEKYLDKTKDLIVVPDGRLALLPFESLIVNRQGENGRPVFLIDQYRIKYIQSASVLGILRRYYRQNSDTNRFIGFGDPVYDYRSFSRDLGEKDVPKGNSGDEVEEILRGKYDGAGGFYNRLKGTGDEVRAIAAIFDRLDGGDAIVRLREKAVEEEVKSDAMKGYDYIHLACHSLLSDGFQSLVLSQDVPKHSEDGYLTLNEVMNCDFNAKLVVLSACNTGGGSLERGEGVTGLTRAIMYAGTPAVVASLWKVDDSAAKELMVRFYENFLGRKMSKVEALRQAKLWMLNNERFSSPRHWSAFVMYGE